MPSEYAIETSGLTKVYRSRWKGREVRAVDGISLSVPRGTTFGLLGPNGAGKTTFVKMLLSAVHPTAGSALIFGRERAIRKRGGRSATCRRTIASQLISRARACWIFTPRSPAWNRGSGEN